MGARVSTNAITAILFGLAIVCGGIAGVFLLDVDGLLVDNSPENYSTNSTGGNYTGIVGAQEAEVRDEYNARSFEEQLVRSSSNESRAAVIQAETRQIEATLENLETRKADLQEIDDGNRAQVVSFVAQSRALEQRLNRVQQAAETLSPSLRTEFELTEQTFGPLRDRIASLTTPAMNDLARQIAGDDVGDDLDDRDDRDEEDGDDQDGEDDDDRDGEDDDDQDGEDGDDRDGEDDGDQVGKDNDTDPDIDRPKQG